MLELSGVEASWIRGREPFGHAGQTAHIIVGGVKVGFLCRLKPSIERELGADEGVFVFELNMDGILNGQLPKFGGSSRFPSVSRDMRIHKENPFKRRKPKGYAAINTEIPPGA